MKNANLVFRDASAGGSPPAERRRSDSHAPDFGSARADQPARAKADRSGPTHGGFHLAVLLVVAAIPLLGLGACAKEKPADTPAANATAGSGLRTVADFFPIKVGDRTVRMQLAVRSAEMQHGLMDRRDLGRDDGMIFIYEKPQQMSFWMRNTPTALDIGFFNADGVLEEVYPMYPFDETPVGSRSERLAFALEMNQGWFAANGVKPGAKLDAKALAAALKARGFEAKKYGLSD